VARRFGLVDHAEHTLSAIGRAMGFSKERARQLVASGLARMARTTPDAIRAARPPSSRDPAVREALMAFLRDHAHLSTREAARAFREQTGASVGHEAVRLARARGREAG
jgi:AraC-like DNA-binding protein